jgi:uridine phosphorylase
MEGSKIKVKVMKKNFQPTIRCGEGDIAKYVLMPGDPGRIVRIGGLMDSYKEVASNREFRTITGIYKGISVSACSTGIGAPSTAFAIEELARIGAEVLIRVGTCGAPTRPEVKVGDLVIPEGVIREDGTSKMYIPDRYPAVPDPHVYIALVKATKKLGFEFHTGISRSGDTFYAKLEELYDFWGEKMIASEMEASALLTIARLKNLKAGCVFTVIDKAREPWKSKTFRGFAERNKRAKAVKGEERCIKVALEAITLLEKGNLI